MRVTDVLASTASNAGRTLAFGLFASESMASARLASVLVNSRSRVWSSAARSSRIEVVATRFATLRVESFSTRVSLTVSLVSSARSYSRIETRVSLSRTLSSRTMTCAEVVSVDPLEKFAST
ncbi:hypothetical protein [Haloarchaeobius amylolyticus]|uniref:hypothetical protein n=1 Tax=Haloarchaeobius amylolyticus TaxID=1198296 RepID=UPI0022701203